MRQHRHTPSASGRRHAARRGVSLLEGLVALSVLAFGLLTLIRMQSGLVAQATDGQSRQTATQLTSELMTLVRVDPANAVCYTVPAASGCANAAAATRTATWASRVASSLPGPVATTSVLDAATGLLTVRIQWQSKGSIDTRQVEAVTDVRT